MNIIFTPMFFGFFFTLILIMLLLKFIFKWRFPIIKIAIAFFLIIILYKIAAYKFPTIAVDNILFCEEKSFSPKDSKTFYLLIFGDSSFDLSGINFVNAKNQIRIINFGGKLKIFCPTSYPIKIDATVFAGNNELPHSEPIFFGKRSYQTKIFDPRWKNIILKINTMFGTTIVRNK